MKNEGLGIHDDFPPVSPEEWRALVEKDLKGASFEKRLVGKTFEGITVQPLYTNRGEAPRDVSGLPGQAPYTRGGTLEGNVRDGWRVWPVCGCASALANREAVTAHLEGGADGVVLRFDTSVRLGSAPVDGVSGFVARGAADLGEALADARLEAVDIVLDVGAAAPVAAAALVAVAQEREIEPRKLGGALNMDPLGALAVDGALPFSLERAYDLMASIAAAVDSHERHMFGVGVSAAPYHEAGGNAAQELAASIATGVAYLKALEERGVAPDDFARRALLTFSVGRDVFMEIAKLRAARALWARILEACGVAEAGRAVAIHAVASRRCKTVRDPWVNMLRGTTDCFAGALGGASAISVASFDEAVGEPEELGTRVARNTQLILQRESGLHRVVDPAGGSWYVEELTERLITDAWSLLQEIESRGGMAAVLTSGWFGEQLEATHELRGKAVAKRREAITGVSEFPKVDEKALDRVVPGVPCDGEGAEAPVPALEGDDWFAGAVQALGDGASLAAVLMALSDGSEATCEALPQVRDAAPFEALRDAGDEQLARSGRRPRAFLANMGPIPQHRARAMFSDNLFQAGGFEVVGNDGFPTPDDAVAAFRAADCDGAVICSTDKTYPELVPAVAAGLKAAGARFVVLAGRPGEHEEAWRQAGVDVFIYLGCDVLATLSGLLERLEVIE